MSPERTANRIYIRIKHLVDCHVGNVQEDCKAQFATSLSVLLFHAARRRLDDDGRIPAFKEEERRPARANAIIAHTSESHKSRYHHIIALSVNNSETRHNKVSRIKFRATARRRPSARSGPFFFHEFKSIQLASAARQRSARRSLTRRTSAEHACTHDAREAHKAERGDQNPSYYAQGRTKRALLTFRSAKTCFPLKKKY